MSLSQREIGQLRALLSKATISPPAPKSKKRRTRRKRKNNNPKPIGAGVTRVTNAPNANKMGEVVATRRELLSTIKISSSESGVVDLNPSSDVMAWLQKLTAAFERIEWLSATLHWQPHVGANTSGSVAFGVDWGASPSSTTRAKVLATTPCYESPVWQAGNLVLPQKYLMSRRYYLISSKADANSCPGSVIWSLAGGSSGTSYGEIWITYKVRLSGTTA